MPLPKPILFSLGFLLLTGSTSAVTPSEAQVHAAAGAGFLAKGDPTAAVKSYEHAAALEPSNSELHRQLGDAYGLAAQKAGMLSKMSWGKKVIAAYEKAVELDPKNVAARQSLMSIYQMAPGMMGGGMDKAYAQAAEIRKLDADRGHVAYAILYAAEKKYAEALAEIEAVLQSTPDHYAALFEFGRLSALTGERLDRGMDALSKCLEITPTPGAPGHDAAHWRLGVIWEKKGDKAAARAAYQASLKINPRFQQAIDALKKLD